MPEEINQNEELDAFLDDFLSNNGPHSLTIKTASPDKTVSTVVSSSVSFVPFLKL
jgi:hypothetical protein